MRVFCFLAGFHKILTVDNLKKRGHILVNGCPAAMFSLGDSESFAYSLSFCYKTLGSYSERI